MQLSEHHLRTVYLSGLPSSVTVPKLEGLLEMEADCNEVKEIYLVKVSRRLLILQPVPE